MLENMLTRFSWTIKLARGRLETRKLSLFRGFSTDFNRSLNKLRTSNIFHFFNHPNRWKSYMLMFGQFRSPRAGL